MGYVESNLAPGEKIVHRTRLHWIVFFWPAVVLIVALMAFQGDSPEAGKLFALLGGILAFFTFLSLWTSEFAVTTKRVIFKVGVFRRRTVEILLTKVESINVDQSILGRILGFGTIEVTGSGVRAQQFFKIGAPLRFRQQIQEQATASQSRS